MMLGAEKKGHKKSYGHAMKRWFAPKKVVEAQNNRTIFGRFFKYRNGHHLAHKKQTPQFFLWSRGMHSKFQQRFEDKYLKKHV